MIDDLMLLPEYQNSFNKVINHALKYGVVELYEKIFVKDQKLNVEEIEQVKAKEIIKSPEEQKTEDYMDEIVTLLTEDVAYLTMIKSIVSSLFNAEAARMGGGGLPQEKFEDGLYRRTPKYLEAYEMRALKNIRGKK